MDSPQSLLSTPSSGDLMSEEPGGGLPPSSQSDDLMGDHGSFDTASSCGHAGSCDHASSRAQERKVHDDSEVEELTLDRSPGSSFDPNPETLNPKPYNTLAAAQTWK